MITLKDEIYEKDFEQPTRAASANEYTGLMYTPAGDEEERHSYSEIQPIMTDPADSTDTKRKKRRKKEEIHR